MASCKSQAHPYLPPGPVVVRFVDLSRVSQKDIIGEASHDSNNVGTEESRHLFPKPLPTTLQGQLLNINICKVSKHKKGTVVMVPRHCCIHSS